jgi:leukotriene-A4 hydrolase
VFLERKAILSLFGLDYYKVEAFNGNNSMKEDILSFGITSNYTSLFPSVNGTNPDDSMTSIPYQKGFLFLTYLDGVIGTSNMQSLLRSYILKYSNQSVVWEQFRDEFIAFV